MIDRRTLIKGAGAAVRRVGARFPGRASGGRRSALLRVRRRSRGHVPGRQGVAGRSPEGADQADRGAQCEGQLHHRRAFRSGDEGGQRAPRTAIERGDARPLEGITVAIKDEDGRAGWRTSMGSLIFKDQPRRRKTRRSSTRSRRPERSCPFQTTVPEFYLMANASTRA